MAEGRKGTTPKAEAGAPALDQRVASLSFEEALAELEGIVASLEKGNVPLEESIAIYELGEALKKRCEALLRAAEARVETITRDADGAVAGTAPLDPAG